MNIKPGQRWRYVDSAHEFIVEIDKDNRGLLIQVIRALVPTWKIGSWFSVANILSSNDEHPGFQWYYLEGQDRRL